MWKKRRKKHVKKWVKVICHKPCGCDDHDDHHHEHHESCCDEGIAKVSQSFDTGTVTGTANLLVPISLNLGDATVFNRSNQNGYNNTL